MGSVSDAWTRPRRSPQVRAVASWVVLRSTRASVVVVGTRASVANMCSELVDCSGESLLIPMTSGTDLIVVVARGPQRTVIRPAELEDQALQRFVMAEALIGADAPCSLRHGVRT